MEERHFPSLRLQVHARFLIAQEEVGSRGKKILTVFFLQVLTAFVVATILYRRSGRPRQRPRDSGSFARYSEDLLKREVSIWAFQILSI